LSTIGRARQRIAATWRLWWCVLAVGATLPCAVAALTPPLIEPASAWMIVSDATTPPQADAAWQPTTLPDNWAQTRPGLRDKTSWYRIPFERQGSASWAAYLPYLYDGGQVWLNGALLERIPETNAQVHVNWERPHLLVLPEAMLRADSNELLVRAALTDSASPLRFPRVSLGSLVQLQPLYERRLFWVRTMPQITVVLSLLVASIVLFIWWRRPSEVLYGLFGLAAAMWGIRTLTFVVEMMPTEQWHWWRVAYHSTTGGFIVVMALFALRHADLRLRWLERTLVAYWFIGPLWLASQGSGVETLVGRLWTAGMIPIGLSIVGFSAWAFARRRDVASAALLIAVGLAVVAGIHDYLIAWHADLVGRWFPGWAGHRVFLLHHGANLLLVVMGALLTARFITTLGAIEMLNRTLEARVAERERELAGNYERLGMLQREHAAVEERQRIMRDLHDGLGSQLFTALSRVERGDIGGPDVAQALRGCIADMRLALEASAQDDHDFLAALGNFRYRWDGQLHHAGLHVTWHVDVPDDTLVLPPHAALQLLRVLQEALTNVLKHAQATRVRIAIELRDDALHLSVEDNGRGLSPRQSPGGRGLANMRARADGVGAQLELRSAESGGTAIALRLALSRSI